LPYSEIEGRLLANALQNNCARPSRHARETELQLWVAWARGQTLLLTLP